MFTSHLSGNMKNRAPRANRHITFSRWKTFWVVQPYSGKRSWILISWTCARLENGGERVRRGVAKRERERERERKKKNSPGRSGPGPGRAPRGCKRGARSPRRRPRARNKCRAPYWKNPRLSHRRLSRGPRRSKTQRRKELRARFPLPRSRRARESVGRARKTTPGVRQVTLLSNDRRLAQ